MRILLLAPIVAAVLSSTSPPVSPIRIGATGSFLTDDDVAQIRKLAVDTGRKAWVIVGDPVPKIPGTWFVSVYLELDGSNRDVRRGVLVKVQAPLDGPAAYKKSKIWTRVSSGEFAQVAVPGRNPDEVLGSSDLSRPFVVSGTMADDTLKSLVAFIRTSPKVTAPPVDPQGKPLGYPFEQVEGLWPIDSITEKSDGVQVSLVDYHQGRAGQLVVLLSNGPSWIVERISTWDVN